MGWTHHFDGETETIKPPNHCLPTQFPRRTSMASWPFSAKMKKAQAIWKRRWRTWLGPPEFRNFKGTSTAKHDFLHVFTGFYILIPPQCESFLRCLMTLWYLDPPSTKNKWVKVRQETIFPGSGITHLKSCGCDGTSTMAKPANQSTNQGQYAIPCIWFVLSICICIYIYMCTYIYIYIYIYIFTYWYNMCI